MYLVSNAVSECLLECRKNEKTYDVLTSLYKLQCLVSCKNP